MNTHLELKTGNWLLVVGSRTTLPTILRSIGRLAETGPVRVVDNGFAFNPFIVRTGMHAGLDALQRIRVYKAYSCREMLSVLESLESGPQPFVVLDFLATFFYFFEGVRRTQVPAGRLPGAVEPPGAGLGWPGQRPFAGSPQPGRERAARDAHPRLQQYLPCRVGGCGCDSAAIRVY